MAWAMAWALAWAIAWTMAWTMARTMRSHGCSAAYMSTQRLTWVDEARGAAAAVLVQPARVVLVLIVLLEVPQRHCLLSPVRVLSCTWAEIQPEWPPSIGAHRPVDWRRLAEALGSPREASGERAS